MALPLPDLQQRLRGVFGFPVTPFHADGSLHLEAFTRHVRWMAGTGVDAIFVCAGTGEGFSLDLEEYSDAVAAAVQTVGGTLPVLAGCGYSTPLAVRLARLAEAAGADGLLLLPPYLLTPEQAGLESHVRAVADATGLGVLLYHRDNALYSPSTVERLASQPTIIGFKDGHGNLEQFGRIVLALGDRLAYMNGMPTAEMTYPAFHALGCRGYSSALSNFAPHITLRFHAAVERGDLAEQQRILRRVIEPICAVRDLRKGYAVAYVKAAVNLTGLLGPEGAGPVRPPLIDLPPDHLELLRRVLDEAFREFPA